jgi:ATP-dependent Lon protease
MFNLSDELIDTTELADMLTEGIPILPLRGTVAFPFIVMPLSIGVPRSTELIKWAVKEGSLIGLFTSREPEIDEPTPDQIHNIGVVARIHRVTRNTRDSETHQIVVQGIERIKIEDWTETEPFLKAKVSLIPDEVEESDELEIEAFRRRMLELSQGIVEHLPQIPNEVNQFLEHVEDPRVIVYTIASNLRMDFDDQLDMLLEDSLREKMSLLTQIMSRELEVLEIGRQIKSDTQQKLDQTQREFYLRQQLRAIQKELGDDDEGAISEEYRQKITDAGMPEESEKEALRELSRMEKLQPQSAEFGVIQTYLDWMVELPWNKLSDDNLDIQHARDILHTDHYDMEDVKERILEYLAVRKLLLERNIATETAEKGYEQDRAGGSILLFVGPPGVGKTSLGRSIARSLGREFTRMSLGGVRDEAEIRGHRRTYIGAMPGRIIQALKRAQTRNPVFMLDEVDKIGSDWRGDPSSALLEVLDPQQNYAFRDHYLDVDFDLSQVMFIATANTLDTIPGPLRDRMEIIQLDGYTEFEKVEIARGYLVPRQVKANGLLPSEIEYHNEAIRKVIRDYTREAGVRNLEREIGRIARKVATKIAGGEVQESGVFVVAEDDVPGYLGKPKFHFEAALRTEKAGVATGLAVTSVGGDVLFVEASRMPGKDILKLTGQLGDVMKESAQIALSYVRSHAEEIGIDSGKFRDADIHMHVPAGAVPKDGPSAGVTMVTALVSLLTGRPVRADVGMTGEVSLQGQVLPIGGLKQKVLAAHRAGLKTVIFPKLNEADLEDVPADVQAEMRFVVAETVDDVLEQALSSAIPFGDALDEMVTHGQVAEVQLN